MSKINLTYENKEYVLEYSRQSVRMMESQGFILEKLGDMPMTMIPLLFSGAFLKNCKGVKRKTIDDIFESIPEKTELLEALIEMYVETTASLTDEAAEGNVQWARVE